MESFFSLSLGKPTLRMLGGKEGWERLMTMKDKPLLLLYFCQTSPSRVMIHPETALSSCHCLSHCRKHYFSLCVCERENTDACIWGQLRWVCVLKINTWESRGELWFVVTLWGWQFSENINLAPTTIPTHLRTKGQNVKLYRVDLMTLKQLEMEWSTMENHWLLDNDDHGCSAL